MSLINPECILIILNLVAGFGCAVPVAGFMAKAGGKPAKVSRCFAILIGVYFIECVALVMGMGIPVFSVGLAFVWGVVFGLRLKNRMPAHNAMKASFLISLYSSLPALSFIIIPVLFWIGGVPVLSPEAGAGIGIPRFVPWPLSTILGFYVIPALGAAVFKTIITSGGVRLLIHLGKKSA